MDSINQWSKILDRTIACVYVHKQAGLFSHCPWKDSTTTLYQKLKAFKDDFEYEGEGADINTVTSCIRDSNISIFWQLREPWKLFLTGYCSVYITGVGKIKREKYTCL